MNEQVLSEQLDKLSIRARVKELKSIRGFENLEPTLESDYEVVFDTPVFEIIIDKNWFMFKYKREDGTVRDDAECGKHVVDKDEDHFLLTHCDCDMGCCGCEDGEWMYKGDINPDYKSYSVPNDTKMESIVQFRMDELVQIETDNLRDMERECDYEGNMDTFRGIEGFENLKPTTERTYDSTFLTEHCALCVSDVGFVFILFVDGEPVATLEGNELFENNNDEVVVMRDMQTVGYISKKLINPEYKGVEE